MARLRVITSGLNLTTLDLRLGVNHVGRDPHSDFPLFHPSVSVLHCELIVSNDGVLLHDCQSTNGTFVNGRPVTEEVWLEPGQQLRFGNVELLVESTDVNISLPKRERPAIPKPPVVLADGLMLCPRHSDHLATFKCTNCHEIMCSGCVRMIRRKGGKPLFLCVVCHQRCERMTAEKPASRNGFLNFLEQTVRLQFTPLHGPKKEKPPRQHHEQE